MVQMVIAAPCAGGQPGPRGRQQLPCSAPRRGHAAAGAAGQGRAAGQGLELSAWAGKPSCGWPAGCGGPEEPGTGCSCRCSRRGTALQGCSPAVCGWVRGRKDACCVSGGASKATRGPP